MYDILLLRLESQTLTHLSTKEIQHIPIASSLLLTQSEGSNGGSKQGLLHRTLSHCKIHDYWRSYVLLYHANQCRLW